jgi:quercetin dioxygenase-like cupin family protein
MTLDEFTAWAHSQGADEVLVREYKANEVIDTHTHKFSVNARVAEGEMWLTVNGQERHLVAGDSFSLDRNTEHAERYGPEGAVYWAGRTN